MKLDEFEWVSIAFAAILALAVTVFSNPRAAQAVHDAYVYAPDQGAPYVGF